MMNIFFGVLILGFFTYLYLVVAHESFFTFSKLVYMDLLFFVFILIVFVLSTTKLPLSWLLVLFVMLESTLVVVYKGFETVFFHESFFFLFLFSDGFKLTCLFLLGILVIYLNFNLLYSFLVVLLLTSSFVLLWSVGGVSCKFSFFMFHYFVIVSLFIILLSFHISISSIECLGWLGWGLDQEGFFLMLVISELMFLFMSF